MQNKKDVVISERSGANSKRTIGLLIIVAVIIVAAGGLLYLKHRNDSSSGNGTVNDAISNATKQALDSKNYSQYQLRLTFTANGQISQGDYKGAEKTLDTIIKNVPADKITSSTYRAYWSLYQKTGDSKNRKKYAQLAADKLKAEGQLAAASDFQQDANSN